MGIENVVLFRRPDSPFQQRFSLNEEFYTADYIRRAILECFPERRARKLPFSGLLYIQESWDSFVEESQKFTQRYVWLWPREVTLEWRIPPHDGIPEGSTINIVEARQYKDGDDIEPTNYSTELVSTDLGYIAVNKV